MLSKIWQNIQTFRRPLDQDIDEELRFHIDMRQRENTESGMQVEEARKEALRRFGDLDRISKTCMRVRRRYRAGRMIRAAKLLTWPLVVYGLTLRLSGTDKYTPSIGTTLIAIGLLWRLLLYVRNTRQAAGHHLRVNSENTLLFTDPLDDRKD